MCLKLEVVKVVVFCVKCFKLCESVYMISSHHSYQFDDLDPISETQGYQR